MRLSSVTPTIAAAALAALSLATSPILAQGAKPATETKKGASSKSAETFVTKAANGGLFEVESSKVAVQKAQRDDVKSFAQQMVDDHGKANQELMAEAQQAGIQVPAKLDSAHQARLDKLNGASGAAFDRAYIAAQETAHREAVSLFRTYAKSGDNAGLKAFAGKTLPVIEGHETKLKQLQKSASGKADTKSGKSNSPSRTQ